MQEADKVKEAIWRGFLVLIPLVVALAVASYAYIAPRLGTYTLVTDIPMLHAVMDEELVFDQPGVVEVLSYRPLPNGSLGITVGAVSDGETRATLNHEGSSDYWYLKVRHGAVLEAGINFNGWRAVQASTCVFFAALVVLFARGLWKLWRISWYGYTMVGCGGCLLFCLFQFAFFTALFFSRGVQSFSTYLSDLIYMAEMFALCMMILMFPLILAIGVSNVSLVRHEGMRPVNILGILASVAWIWGFLAWTLYDWRWLFDYPMAIRIANTAIGMAITFGECLLLSTMLCAWLASRHVPKHGVDYLVILGCGIRDDGTPCPLLAGRVDRAASFDQAHVAAGDPPATFVPSGGQGSDEPISEAQSMGNYLQDHWDIPRERIALEDRSTTTRENMAFSREVIERHAGRSTDGLSVGFSTTNYHVFRGYVAAHQAGMAVEGMGAKTKYYFWPNAFLREFVGLLVHRWKTLVQVYAVVTLIYLIAEIILIKA